MNQMYEGSLHHIKDELRRLDLMLRLQVSRFRVMQPCKDKDNIFTNLCLTDSEIDGLLQGSDKNEISDYSEVLSALEIMSGEISEKRRESMKKGIFLGLPALSSLFNLNRTEELAVLICLAPEIDPKYGKIYAYLNNDATRKNPSLGIVIDLGCNTDEEKINGRICFSAYSPLFRYRLLSFGESNTLISLPLKMDRRIVNYILGLNYPADDLEHFLKFVQPKKSPGEENLKSKLAKLLQRTRKAIVHLKGPYGAGKKELAVAVCSDFNLPLLIVDTESLVSAQDYENVLRRCLRETILMPAAIYFDNFDVLLGEDRREKLKFFLCAVEELSELTFTAGEMLWEPKSRFFFSVEIPYPDYNERVRQWKMALERLPLSEDISIEAVSSKFKLTAGQIQDAAMAAHNYAVFRDPEMGRINNEDLYNGCKARSNQTLSKLAKKINPFYAWSDIALPNESIQQLRDICSHVNYRQIVFGNWGFDRKLSLGRGLNVLFSGPSGSGKTMAAEIVANELKLDLYKIDLSTVVSKYIGETEKNLSKIFHEADTSNAIIFFDEADALFGKRSEVRDSHDRYANIEINYLLQKMEEYEGIVILATNLKKHLDEAFLRRMHFVVEFPLPDEAYRLRIWKSLFPREVPKSDIDFDFLAKHLKITGGNIKNIVLSAAFLAASNSGVIDMEHIILAAKREYEKIGKVCVESDFGKYYPLVKTER